MNRPAEPNDLPRFAELNAEYEILRELGRGGTAIVYLARDRELAREVTIKVIRATYVEDDEAAARLVREARTLGRLQHPNIVALYGTRHLPDGSLALIMEYVPGHTLKSEVRQHGPLPHTQVTRVLADIAHGLAYAHRQHIVHRDIKPENIYIDQDTGIARLADFGIARTWDVDSSLTLPGTAIGTPTYMSPEQIEGGQLDGRSDLFSLSLVGYEMLTGRRPWEGESLFSIVYKQKHEELPSLAAQRPDVPAKLRSTIERALRKEPEDRWPDADAFLNALGQPVAHAPFGPAPAMPFELVTPDYDPDSVTSSFHRATVEQADKPAQVMALPPVAAALAPRGIDANEKPAVRRRLSLERPSKLVAVVVALVMLGGIAALARSGCAADQAVHGLRPRAR